MKFVADRMLGKLAKILRILGFDVLYSNRIHFRELVRIARDEKRIILTRNSLIKTKEGEYTFFFINNNEPKRQLKEVIDGLDLKISPSNVFTRCLLCNHELKKIEREDVEGRVPDYVFETQRDFSLCRNCNKIFWKGTHHKNMLASFEGYLSRATETDT
ncbi:MAG: Mut7-C RNAse domain-containing protein [Pseudomonadota bacterium]